MGKALAIFADNPRELNTSNYRIRYPREALESRGHSILASHYTQVDWKNIPESVLWERVFFPQNASWLRACGAKKVVVTFDDNYDAIPPQVSSYDYWRANHKDFVEALRMADACIVPSHELVEYYTKKHKIGTMQYVPNYIDVEMWGTAEPKRVAPEGKIVIGWGGSRGHIVSWDTSHAAQALSIVQKSFPDVVVNVVGPAGGEALARNGVSFTPTRWMSWKEWPSHVRGFDIGIVPMGGKYDRYRSNLKLVELGSAGVPWIADTSPAYSGAQGGIFVRSTDEWVSALETMIKGTQLRRECAREGRKWAKSFDVYANIGIYEKLLNLESHL